MGERYKGVVERKLPYIGQLYILELESGIGLGLNKVTPENKLIQDKQYYDIITSLLWYDYDLIKWEKWNVTYFIRFYPNLQTHSWYIR